MTNNYQQHDLYNLQEINLKFQPITGSKKKKKQYFLSEIESQIMSIITHQQAKQIKDNLILINSTKDLEESLLQMEKQIQTSSNDEVLKIRVHQLAINKILVFTHAKSDFRLVIGHFKLGKAYLEEKCYEQAINHLTIASTKNSKLGEIKQTKIYNSFILTGLGECYYSIGNIQYSLDILNRAYDIQSSFNGQRVYFAQETVDMLAICFLKQNIFKDSVKIIQKFIDILSKQYPEIEVFCNKILEVKTKTIDNVKFSNFLKNKDQIIEIVKAILQKVEVLTIDFDKKSLKSFLQQLITKIKSALNQSSIIQIGQQFQELITNLEEIIKSAIEEIKNKRIFKFKIFAEEDSISNAIDIQLKSFLKQYEEGTEKFKVLTHQETIQIYQLVVYYCSKFNDYENQLLYLKKLENIYQFKKNPESRLHLLKIKRNIALILNQRKDFDQTLSLLQQIQQIEKEMYGSKLTSLKKTKDLIEIIKTNESKNLQSNKPVKKVQMNRKSQLGLMQDDDKVFRRSSRFAMLSID